jgi:hypothetical protein
VAVGSGQTGRGQHRADRPDDRYALDHGYHVILDGILYADRYEQMLAALRADHRGPSCFFYWT